jgi:acylphosphatase
MGDGERRLMRLHVVVRGRVQGVGFRWFVNQRARAFDLAGWVRNRPDGGVEVAADGPDESIAKFRAELLRGPDGARVEAADDVDAPGESLTRPFMIVR